jgi:hypothetical protein
LGQDEDTSDPDVLLAGLLLLLHLCRPAQHGVDAAAAACAALAALLADGCRMYPGLSPVDVQDATDAMINAYNPVIVAAMQHEGLAAKLAQQRPDAITLLVAAAYSEVGEATGTQERQQLESQNAELFSALRGSAVQVSPRSCCYEEW